MRIAGWLIAAALATTPALAAPPAAPPRPTSDPCIPPPDVARWLKTQPGWHVVRPKDLPADEEAMWRKSWPGFCPGMARADLDGRRQSYGLVLMRRGSRSLRAKLVVLRDTGGGLVALPQSRLPSTLRPPVIFSNPPATVAPWDDPGHPRRIPHPYFVVEQLETWTIVYYLDGERLRSVQTSD